VIIRVMRPTDIPSGLALCRASGWNRVAADWEHLLALGGSTSFVAELDGRVVGTATAVPYERRFAWIGMVLVDPDARGRGIGTALTGRAVDALGDVPARLDATPAGHPLYCRLGFVEESRLCRLTREPADVPDGAFGRKDPATLVRPMREEDLEAVTTRDRGVFGADRRRLLAWAIGGAPALAWVAEGTAGLLGYCFGRRGHRWSQVGPVVANTIDTGLRLVAASVAGSPGSPLIVDAAVAVAGWTERLAAVGFVQQRPFIRMSRGRIAHPGEIGSYLAILGPEWG